MSQYSSRDQILIEQRVDQFRDQVRRHLAGGLDAEQFKQSRLRNGLYLQRTAHMLRVAIPCGVLNSTQLRMLARIARTHDRGCGHFTTRQNIQFNWPALEIDIMTPRARQLQSLVRQKVLYSFYTDGHSECCGIRKVEPLRRKLTILDAWITGQRRDQSPGTRTALALVHEDAAFSTPARRLIKVNPLATWTSSQGWQHIRNHDVP